MIEPVRSALFRPVDASAIAVFRIAFGALLLFESINYGLFLCLDCYYRETELLFKYRYFEWVGLLPGHGLELQFLCMAIAALGVMLGWHYRICMLVFTVLFSWHFLLDEAVYLNHFYMAILLCVIMIFVPANRYWSIDAARDPQSASATVPNWSRLWLIAQLEIILILAGVVKLNADWLNLEPMRLWMNYRSASYADTALGPLLAWLTQDWGIALASYGAIALHLVGAPLLLFRRTRLAVFVVYGFFHLTNSLVFDIGIFPWMTMAATLLLFDPDWPRQFVGWANSKGWLQRWSSIAEPPVAVADNREPLAHVDRAMSSNTPADKPAASARDSWSLRQAILVIGIGIWLLAQILIPFRHHLAPGNVAWNEDGHRFSWRMKLRDKQGVAVFVVVSDGKQARRVHPRDHLTRQQTRKMACIPDMIWQFAQWLEHKEHERGATDVQVYADVMCSLNTREPAALVNRLVDLTSIPRDEPVSNWTYPLRKRLPNPIF